MAGVFTSSSPQAPIVYGVVVSILLHMVGVVFFTIQMKKEVALKAPVVMRVQLVSAPKTTKKPVKEKTSSPKPEPIKTQHSPAPKAPPKKQPKVKESKAPTKIVSLDKPKPKPIPAPKKEPLKKRPPLLDRTPEKKKVVKNKDKKAKTVTTPPDDFMAALNFLDELKSDADKADLNQLFEEADADEMIDLSYADNALLGKIRDHIEQYWVRPPGLRVENLSAVLELRLKPDGKIESLKIVEKSGQLFYDNSLLRAVRKAEPIPIPLGKYKIFKMIELHFSG